MIRLDSYSVGSAVFGPFGAGASITGNLIIEKIVSNVDNQADWRYLHIPLQNVAISEVNEGVAPNGFYTYGYTGANQLSAGSFVSTYTYTEGNNNAAGGGFADGWTAETDAANLFSSIQGRIFYIGGTSGSGAKSTYSLKATGAVLTGPQSITGLGVSINGGGLNDQGWHLIANPYACPVNLSLANFVGIQGLAAYVYSSTSGSFQTLSTGDVIPAWQSFFVQSTGTGSVTFNESDKNTSHTLDVYKSKEKLDRLVLSLNSDSLGTSTSIRMEEMSGAQTGFDAYDAFGLSNGGYSPSMFFRIDSHDIAINRVAQYEGQSIPLSLYIQAAGYYEIALENSPFGDLCINLEDLETGDIHDLSSEKIVGFHIQNTGVVNRFKLHLNTHPIVSQSTENLSCHNSSDGQLELELTPNFDFSLQNNLGSILDQKSNVNGPIIYTDLEAGIYQLKFESNSNSCVLNQSIELFQPEQVSPEFEWTGNQIPGVELSFTNKSKGASSFVWDFGDGSIPSTETNPEHTYSEKGSYKVKLLASNGNLDCDQSSESTIELLSTNVQDEFSEGSLIEINGGRQIQVTLSSPEASAEVEIYNSIGQLVQSSKMSSDFSFRPTNSGIYIVQVKLGGSSKSSKVLVNLMD